MIIKSFKENPRYYNKEFSNNIDTYQQPSFLPIEMTIDVYHEEANIIQWLESNLSFFHYLKELKQNPDFYKYSAFIYNNRYNKNIMDQIDKLIFLRELSK